MGLEMEWKLLIEEILDRLKSISQKQTEIETKLTTSAVNDTRLEMQLESIKEAIEQDKTDIKDCLTRLKELEKSKTEISGFAKYVRFIWVILAAIVGYYIQNIKK